jgi:short-subunit dehydrogenase
MNEGKVVVITGVSKGFGEAFAKKFKEEGFLVAGISRNKPDIPLDFHIQADLTNREEREKVVFSVIANLKKIDVFINNAGVGLYDLYLNTKEDDLRKLMELNFFVPVCLSKQVVPYLKQTKGTLINISSVAGKVHVPYMGAYCSSKFALNAFSNTLRSELLNSEVNVLNIVAGRINTGFSKRALGSAIPPNTPFAATPDKLANAVFKAYKKRKKEITFPLFYKFILPLFKFSGSLYDKIAYNKWNKG